MKLPFLAILFFTTILGQTATVKLKLVYRSNPLCHWEVSLKHGDAVIGRGKSDENGEVTFSSVQLLSKSVDASGYKKTANGEKKWDVKGYIALDDNNTATVNFEKIIEETGAPAAMMEAAWGLTLNDCSGGSSAAKSEKESNSTSTQKSSAESSTQTSTKNEKAPEPSLEEKMADMKREREENQAEYKAQQEQQKQALEQKKQRLDKKVEDAKIERDKQTPGSVEHSNASYEVRDLEIDRDLTQLKLDKMLDQQASSNGMLSKSERERYNTKTDALEEEQKQLRKNKKEGILFGQTSTLSGSTDTEKEDKKEKSDKENEEDDAPFKIYTPEELANMSTFDLKKTKLSNNQSITKRKTKLKVKAAFYDVAKKTQMQNEIDALTKQVEAIKVILAQRNEKEEPSEEGK